MRGDGTSTFWIIALLVALGISIWVARANSQRADRENAARIKASDENRRKEAEISELQKVHEKELSAKNNELARLMERARGIAKIVEQRKIQFPWLATAIADFHALEAERDAKILETKKHPAVKAAEEVREHSRRRREAELNFRLLRYRAEYYEKLFPWIVDFIGDDVPDSSVDISGPQAEPTDDPVKTWLNDAEYRNLSVTEKNQLALDRWRQSKKSR